MTSATSPWLVPRHFVPATALRNYCKASPALLRRTSSTSTCPTANRAPMFGYEESGYEEFGYEECLDMSAAPRLSPSLRDVIDKYRQLAGGFGCPLPLAAFGLSTEETERVFGIFDEDYHISRFFHFTYEPAAADGSSRSYHINGFPQSHVALDADIESIL